MAARNGFECCLEIGVGVDPVELAGLDEGCDPAPGPAALIMAREERVLAIEGDGPDCPLDDIAVHLDSAVVKEVLLPVHVLGNIAELLA